jgi:predicted butyrate kinase (DUF1464 family)
MGDKLKRMNISLGLEYRHGDWRLCVLEQGKPIEYRSFATGELLAEYISRLCACYPEPALALASQLETGLCPLATFEQETQAPLSLCTVASAEEHDALQRFLVSLSAYNNHSYCLPSVRYLSSVPAFRKRYRSQMGGSDRLSVAATLLYRMRQREAVWPEMRFLLLDMSSTARHITVIYDGCIIDDYGEKPLTYFSPEQAESEELAIALEEDLRQDLAALIAIHHIEDIVLLDRGYTPAGSTATVPLVNEKMLARLGDLYQVYGFPREASEPEGFECALGAALLADGLDGQGLAAEVTEHLMSLAQAEPFEQDRDEGASGHL